MHDGYIRFVFKITFLAYSDISVDFKCSVLDECIEEWNINWSYIKFKRWRGSGFVQWRYFPCAVCRVSKQLLLLFSFSLLECPDIYWSRCEKLKQNQFPRRKIDEFQYKSLPVHSNYLVLEVVVASLCMSVSVEKRQIWSIHHARH